jgi:O-antigen ligase
LAVIAPLLLLSALLPWLPAQRYHILLLGLAPGIAAVLLLLRHPPLGLIGLVVASLIVPLEIGTGSGTSINASIFVLALLIGLWFVEAIAAQEPFELPKSPVWLPLLLFVTTALISFLVGQLPWFTFANQAAPISAQLGGLAIIILSAGAFLLVAFQVRDLRWLQWLTWTFFGLGALYMGGRLLPGILGNLVTGLFNTATVSGSMFWTWLVALALGQAIFNDELRPQWRLTLGGLVCATLYIGIFQNSGWKAGYIPALAAVAVILALRSWKAALMVLVVGAIPAVYLVTEALATDQYSYSTRIDAWLIMLEIIKANPFLGFGPANYYWYTPLFLIRGYYVPFNSHSQYFDIVAQTGLLGLAFFGWFVVAVGKLGWELRAKAPRGFARGYVYGALGGLVGTLVAATLVDWLLPFVYNIGFAGFRASVLAWLFLGGLVSIQQAVKSSKQS